MFALVSSLAVFLLASSAVNARIGWDLSCTTYNGTALVYTHQATICENTISDLTCDNVYTTTTPITPGTDVPRPLACYSSSTGSVNNYVKDYAITNCARTCGYCCETSAYSCQNAQYPRLDCSTISNAQCLSPEWRPIIAEDCPSTCGLCNYYGEWSGDSK